MSRVFTPLPGRFLPQWHTGDYCHPAFLRLIDHSQIHTIVEAGCADAADTHRLLREFPATVHAFEANPLVLPETRRCCAGHPRVTLVEKALWDRDGTIPFYPVIGAADAEAGVNPGASSCFPARPEYVGRYVQSECLVEATRLDSYCAAQGIRAIDLLCLDVQGASLRVLHGLGALIEQVRHVIIEIEVRPIYDGQSLYPEVHAYLKAAGFRQVAEVVRGGWFSDYLYSRPRESIAIDQHRRESADEGSSSRVATVTSENWLGEYAQLNSSFTRRAVLNVGAGFGFFSEFNNMVLAMLYCLQHRIQLKVITSRNIAAGSGLTDYFLPFLGDEGSWHQRLGNTRPYCLPGWQRRPAAVLRRLRGLDYQTQDLWPLFRNDAFYRERFDWPGLGISGDLLHATSSVIAHIWRLQPKIQERIAGAVASLDLPPAYVGFHIRRGDKLIEARRIATADYFRAAEELTDVRAAFVATDDYGVIRGIEASCPGWTIYTRCDPTATGHLQSAANRRTRADQYEGVVRLLTDVEILRRADPVVLTYSSNVGMFLGMSRGHVDRPRIRSVDIPEWQVV